MALKIRRCEFVLPAENVRTGQRQRFCLEPSVELKEIRFRWPSAARVIPLSLQSQRRAAAVEKQHGVRVLEQTAQDRKQAARLLDISFLLAAFKRSNKLKFPGSAF
jgi:hypothetical protein